MVKMALLVSMLLGCALRGNTFLVNPDATSGTKQSVIDQLIPVSVGGMNQWLLLRSQDMTKPVVLFVHGGPGSVLMPYSHHFDSELLRSFNVVHWDQRYAGKSFSEKTPPSSLNINQYVSDCVDVIRYLVRHFKTGKVVLIGHSWGSVIGLLTAQRIPSLIRHYVAVSQLTDFNQIQLHHYQFAGQRAMALKDSDALVVINNMKGHLFTIDEFLNLSGLVMKYGGVFHSLDMRILDRVWQSSPYYSDQDRENQIKGFRLSPKHVWAELNQFKAEQAVKSLDVPIAFFQGEHDRVTYLEDVYSYFNSLRALKGKKMVIFKNSGHFPFWEEPKLFSENLMELIKHEENFESKLKPPLNQ
jgi:pimeloyl-ACP methyl ester carboxylesterase